MDKSYLKRKPTRYLCPICGEWHPWNGGTLESPYKHLETCINTSGGQNTGIYFITYDPEKEELEFEVLGRCRATTITGSHENIPISYFEKENSSQDRVVYSMSFFADEEIGPEYCSKSCKARIEGTCYFFNNYKEATNREFFIPIGFEFGEDVVHKDVEDTTTNKQALKDIENKPKNKKGAISTMENKASTVWKQLYEHSPKENVEIVGSYLDKYKPALKWAVPVVSIYAAYRILNSKDSDLTADNVGDVCKSKLGFDMDSLKDKKALNKLLHLGRPIVLAYGAIKLSSAIFADKNPKELSHEDVEEGLEKLNDAKNKYGWIQPMTEKILPVALSVITVYLMTRKPVWFEKAKEKVMETVGDVEEGLSIYGELAKLFIADKFNINLDDEEQKKKAICFMCLALIVVIGVLLYGKKVLDKKKVEDDDNEPENKALKAFMSQVLVILKKLAPSAFSILATWAITKNFLDDDVIDAEFWKTEEGEESEKGSPKKEGQELDGDTTEKGEEPEKGQDAGDDIQKSKKPAPKCQSSRKKTTQKVKTEDNQKEHIEP